MARACGTAPAQLHGYTAVFATGVSVQLIGCHCSPWIYDAMTDVTGVGGRLGQHYRKPGWDWPVLATSRSTWAVAIVPVPNDGVPFNR